MELAFPLLTLTAAPGLLHIGEQEDQHDPKPPEGKYPYQKPRLPGPRTKAMMAMTAPIRIVMLPLKSPLSLLMLLPSFLLSFA